MEKQQLIKFIGKVMEDSGFKVYKNFKSSNKTVDIYAILPSEMENFGVVVACKNYEKEFEVGVDVLEDMVETKELLNASKVTVVTSSSFSPEAIQYAELNNIKLVDRQGLTELVKKYKKQKEEQEISEPTAQETVPSANMDTNPTINVDTPPIKDSYDEEVVQEFMNNTNYGNTSTSNSRPSLFGGNSNKNSHNLLSKQTSFNRSSLGGGNRPSLGGSNVSISSRETPKIFTRLKPILSNTIVLIILVTVISYIIATLLVIATNISSAIAGVVELLLALALSYGIILFVDRDGGQILVKGTVIFFVSLILLMLLTVIL